MSKYSEKDIKAIISRAAELQQITSGPESLDNEQPLLSLEDVEEIAEEAGLSPEYVRQAAIEYEGVPVEEPLFLETENDYEVELLGFTKGELDQKTWVELRSIIEYSFDNPGKVTRRPYGIVWKARPTGILKHFDVKKSPEVKIKSSKKNSTIRLRKSLKTYNKLKFPFYVAMGIAAFLASLAILDGEMGALIGVVIAVAAGELFRRWAKRKKQKERERLKEIMEKLQRILNRKAKLGDHRTAGLKEPLLENDLREGSASKQDTREAGRKKNNVQSGGE